MTDTREALLEAGVRLYSSMAGELLKGLSAGNVAKEAGFHRQTFYRYWETQSEYVQDLLRHVLGTAEAPVADGATALADRRPPGDIEDFVREVAEHDFVRVAQDARAAMRVGLVAMDALNQPPLADLMQDFYDTTMARLAPGYEALFDHLDRRPVVELTTRDLVRLVQALLLGLVIQAKAADDDPHPAVLFEAATVALLTALTEPVPDEGTATA